MKWVLIIVLICVIMLIANAFCTQYKEKFDFYSNLKYFLNQYQLNLSFKKEKITDFLNNIKAKKQFNLFIKEYQNYLNTNKIDLSDIKILDNEEKAELENIVKSIGCMDSQNEISQVDSFLVSIEKKLKQAEQEKQKLSPMILKLSLLFAIGIAIILI